MNNTLDNLIDMVRQYTEDYSITKDEYIRASKNVKMGDSLMEVIDKVSSNIYINRKNDEIIRQYRKLHGSYGEAGECC